MFTDEARRHAMTTWRRAVDDRVCAPDAARASSSRPTWASAASTSASPRRAACASSPTRATAASPRRCPRVHVAVMGIERIVPDARGPRRGAAAAAPAAPPGRRCSVYTNIITGPRRRPPGAVAEPDGPDQLHIVLVDNGRSRLLGTGAGRDPVLHPVRRVPEHLSGLPSTSADTRTAASIRARSGRSSRRGCSASTPRPTCPTPAACAARAARSARCASTCRICCWSCGPSRRVADIGSSSGFAPGSPLFAASRPRPWLYRSSPAGMAGRLAAVCARNGQAQATAGAARRGGRRTRDFPCACHPLVRRALARDPRRRRTVRA